MVINVRSLQIDSIIRVSNKTLTNYILMYVQHNILQTKLNQSHQEHAS